MNIPEYFEFQNSAKLLAGKDALAQLPYEMDILGSSKPLILTDAGLVQHGILDRLLKEFRGSRVEKLQVFQDIPPDPPAETVEAAARMYLDSQCDGIIALGGGSVLDTAKGLNLLVSGGGDSLRDWMGYESFRAKMVPFAAVPTTSGTGSEATLVSVITDTQREIKMEFISYLMLPHVAVLDPALSQSLPARITAATGIDALVHAIEAYTGKQQNPLSQTHAWTAIELISANLLKCIESPSDTEARNGMAIASYCAGAAFSNSMVGAVHAIGHAVGAVAHVAHGELMGILLPHVLEANLHVIEEQLGKLLLAFSGPDIYALEQVQVRAQRFIAEVKAFIARIAEKTAVPMSLHETALEKAQWDQVIEKAINDGAALTNPVPVTPGYVQSILEAAW